ncbi:hypothetical protein CSUB_C0625 [Candidatus Caldarchaeum subterraneum]|uniref:Uncharacterized protein n=1 Tax=Caldiarchaeum subterraneum TaxID=311458 RepID=E6N5U3_CALS0|nr:hypothetical protein HGMM_F32D08C28 [Candidatus Caldarchaeum subterraneum]BAJ50484.1 hypothetical protein CSUB_C0625 [Candidatus Caldarchaeum subterraneum]
MSVTLRIGDVGRRCNLYWNIPVYNTSASQTGTWYTNSTSFVLATSGSININGFVNTLPNFYDTVRISYSFGHSVSSTGVGEAYMKILGVNGTTFSISSGSVTQSETVHRNMPTNGVITWELWHRKLGATNYVSNPSLTIYLLNRNKTSIMAGELDIGQLFVTGYTLNPQTTFIFDDNAFYMFSNESTTDTLTETFDTPVAVNKVSIIKPTSTSGGVLYLIAV